MVMAALLFLVDNSMPGMHMCSGLSLVAVACLLALVSQYWTSESLQGFASGLSVAKRGLW